jgi:translation initiation factor 2B subunit (eIF-2B alpha/beta/delta family)
VAIHQAVRQVISMFEAKKLHAARSGREVMQALATVVADSQAETVVDLTPDLDTNVDALLAAMPAYAPPLNALHRIYARFERALHEHESMAELRSAVIQSAESYQDWAGRARATIAASGAALIPDGGTVFTFTLSETVLHTLRHARREGRRFRAIVTESRPNNDGLITAKSLAAEGVEVEVGIDGNFGELVPRADVILAGAEAVLSDGSAICKVGTYPCALVAKKNRVPVYVLIDSMKLHATSLLGWDLWLDPIRRQDITQDAAPEPFAVTGRWFDRTPPELLTALVTEKGLIHPDAVSQWMLGMPVSETLIARLGN